MIEIRSYEADDRDAVLDITHAAWERIFPRTQREVPGFVYDNFYPLGWWPRQKHDIGSVLTENPETVWVATWHDEVVGFIAIQIHPEDRMGEVHVIAVHPDHQRTGCGRAMMEFAQEYARSKGMRILMVETVGDSGHAPARAAYEAFGFEPWPVARYFKDIADLEDGNVQSARDG